MTIFKAYDVRGIYPGEVNEAIARRIGAALVAFIGGPIMRDGKPRRIAVGRDMRESGVTLAEQVRDGIRDAGATAVDVGMVTTPLLYHAVGSNGLAAGVMVTASHNPAEWNGLKFLGPDGVFVSAEEMERIHQGVIANERSERSNLGENSTSNVGIASARGGLGPRKDAMRDDDAIKRHIENVLALPIDVERIRARNFRVDRRRIRRVVQHPLNVGHGENRLPSERDDRVAGSETGAAGGGVAGDTRDRRLLLRIERQADHAGERIGEEDFVRDWFLGGAKHESLSVAHLVTVHAASRDLAGVVEFRLELAAKRRVVLRRLDGRRFRLLAGQGRTVGRIPFV
jgi:hypothetical protein